MKYDTFMQAYLDDEPNAVRIGKTLETVLDSLVEQGLAPYSTSLWQAMCRQAWHYNNSRNS